MVNCPKCGFSQPQDQYCASCGIDMLAFRPKEKPFFRKLLSNIIVQLCLLATVVFSVFLVVRHQQNLELNSRVAELESSQPKQIIQRTAGPASAGRRNEPPSEELASSSAAVAAVAPAAESSIEEDAAPAVAPEPPVTTRTTATTASSPTPVPSASPETQAGTGAAAPPTTSSIRISFNEVPRTVMGELASDAAGSFGNIQYGIVSDWTNRLRTVRSAVNWRSLDATVPQSIKVGETTTVHRGPRNEAGGESYGIWIFTKLVKMDETSITLQIEVSRNLPNPNATGGVDQVNRLPLPEMTIPRGSASFVSGLVPHRQAQLTTNEIRIYRTDRVLQILTSENFRAAYTDLAVFIEPVADANAVKTPSAVKPEAKPDSN